MKKIISLIIMILMISSVSVFAEEKSEFQIYKGWNLVNYDVINSLWNKDSTELFYVLNPINKKYYGGNAQIAEKEFAKMYEIYDDDNLPMNGFWIYSNSEKIIRLNGDEGQDSNSLKQLYHLYKGWNLIGITSIMNEQSLNNIKGNCVYSAIYEFEDGGWHKITEKLFDEKLNGALGRGFAIKVENDCSFDFTGNGNVPQVPELPSN